MGYEFIMKQWHCYVIMMTHISSPALLKPVKTAVPLFCYHSKWFQKGLAIMSCQGDVSWLMLGLPTYSIALYVSVGLSFVLQHNVPWLCSIQVFSWVVDRVLLDFSNLLSSGNAHCELSSITVLLSCNRQRQDWLLCNVLGTAMTHLTVFVAL